MKNIPAYTIKQVNTPLWSQPEWLSHERKLNSLEYMASFCDLSVSIYPARRYPDKLLSISTDSSDEGSRSCFIQKQHNLLLDQASKYLLTAVVIAIAAAAVACSLDATSDFNLKTKVHWQPPDFFSCSAFNRKCLGCFLCPALNPEKERYLEQPINELYR